MTQEIGVEALKQVPGLVVLSALTYWFIRSMRDKDKAFVETLITLQARQYDALKEISDEGHEIQKEAIQVMASVREAMNNVERAVNGNTQLIEKTFDIRPADVYNKLSVVQDTLNELANDNHSQASS
jgi:hypothetical protein